MLEDNPTPEMFGAVGDGVHNDAPAINACLAKHGKVYFDAKTYVIGQAEPTDDLYNDNAIYFQNSDAIFLGKGIGRTILKFANNNQLVTSSSARSTRMLASKWGVNCNNTSVKGITFDGNFNNNKSNGTIHAIIITGFNTRISECEFINFGVGDKGVDECFQVFLTIAWDTPKDDATGFIIQNNVFRSPGKKTGVGPKTPVPENTFIGIVGTVSAFLTGVQIVGNSFIDCDFNVVVQQSPIRGITLAYTNKAAVANNTFTNFNGICYYVNSWKNTGVSIVNNTATNIGAFVHLACESMPDVNQISYNENYTIDDNKIELMRSPYFWRLGEEPLLPSAVSYHFDVTLDKKVYYPFRSILVKNNTVQLGEFLYNNVRFVGKLFYGMGHDVDEEFIFTDNVVNTTKIESKPNKKKIIMFSVVGAVVLMIVLILILK